jgi:hypothetical protein
MRALTHQRCLVLSMAFVLLMTSALSCAAQQLVQRGALGKPAQVLDETDNWTTPLLLVSDHDVEVYMPDVTSPEWLRRNYTSYENGGTYTISLFTLYKTPTACQANQVGWGLADANHLNACDSTGYRIRRGSVETQQKSITLIMAAMIDQDGQLDKNTIETRGAFRYWYQLDTNTQAALKVANALIQRRMKLYDEAMQRRK